MQHWWAVPQRFLSAMLLLFHLSIVPYLITVPSVYCALVLSCYCATLAGCAIASWCHGQTVLKRSTLVLRKKDVPRGGSAQWVETVWNRCVHIMDKNLFPMSSGVSEWASQRTNKCNGAREWRKQYGASSEEQANEWAVYVNEWADKRMAQYSTRLFLHHLTHCAVKQGRIHGTRCA